MTEYKPINGRTIEEMDLHIDSWLSLSPAERLNKLEEMRDTVWKYSSREAKEILFEMRGINLSELEKRVADYKREHQLL